jgi:hypothetical protein
MLFKILRLNLAILISLTINSVMAAPQADLVPVAEAMNGGKIAVKNVGDAKSRTSWLTLQCSSSSACPEDPGMAAYVNPMFPNLVSIQIPELKPGQSYSHTLTFWKQLVFKPGKYKFILNADTGLDIPESSETNNTVVFIKKINEKKLSNLSKKSKRSVNQTLIRNGNDPWPLCIPTVGHSCPP